MLIYDEGDIKAYISKQTTARGTIETGIEHGEDYLIEVRVRSEYIGDDAIALIGQLESFIQNIHTIMKIR